SGFVLSESRVDEFVGKLAARLLEALRSMGPGTTVGLLSPAGPEPSWPVAPGVTDPEEGERLGDQWAGEAGGSQSPRGRRGGVVTDGVEAPKGGGGGRGPADLAGATGTAAVTRMICRPNQSLQQTSSTQSSRGKMAGTTQADTLTRSLPSSADSMMTFSCG